MTPENDSKSSAPRWRRFVDALLTWVLLPLVWLLAWVTAPGALGVWVAAAAAYTLALLVVSLRNTMRAGDVSAQRDVPVLVQSLLRPVVLTGLAALAYGFVLGWAVLVYLSRTAPPVDLR